MDENLMTLDEIEREISLWGDWHSRRVKTFLSLVEHVRSIEARLPPVKVGTCCMGSDPTCKGGHPWCGPQDEAPAHVVEPPAPRALYTMPTHTEACPFCGCEAWLYTKPGVLDGATGHRIECEGACHAMTCWWHTKDEALAAWNRRVRCPSCPAPVPARAEAGSASSSATRAGYDLYLRWTDAAGGYHEMRYDVRSTPQATDMSRDITAMLASAREEGRREGLEEAAQIASDHGETCYSDLCCRQDAAPVDSHANVIERAIRALIGGKP